jgi:hypothetical protein
MKFADSRGARECRSATECSTTLRPRFSKHHPRQIIVRPATIVPLCAARTRQLGSRIKIFFSGASLALVVQGCRDLEGWFY